MATIVKRLVESGAQGKIYQIIANNRPLRGYVKERNSKRNGKQITTHYGSLQCDGYCLQWLVEQNKLRIKLPEAIANKSSSPQVIAEDKRISCSPLNFAKLFVACDRSYQTMANKLGVTLPNVMQLVYQFRQRGYNFPLN